MDRMGEPVGFNLEECIRRADLAAQHGHYLHLQTTVKLFSRVVAST
jgi:hypothetical protein